jgi:hypothetical protein
LHLIWQWIDQNWRDWLSSLVWWQAAAAVLQGVSAILLLIVTLGYVRITQRLVKTSVQQARLQQQALKVALFEKRLKIFHDTMGFLAAFARTVQVEIREAEQLLRDTNAAEFLFEQDVVDFINTIYEKATELHARNLALEALDVNDGPGMLKAMEQTKPLEEWLAVTAFGEAKRIFHPYLKFKADDQVEPK